MHETNIKPGVSPTVNDHRELVTCVLNVKE